MEVVILYTFSGLSNKLCVPNKTENLNQRVFNMITGINESKTLTNHISYEWKCKFNKWKCNTNQGWNNNKFRCKFKNYHTCGKHYIWNHNTCICENWKYLASIINDSVITCYEIIEGTVTADFKRKKRNLWNAKFYVIVVFLLITIALLIVVNIYCYLRKYRAKTKTFITISQQTTN